jgi:uncharacterized protein YndB with AHSA1/START domain
MKINMNIEIFCPPEEVFIWISDPEKAKLWQKSVKDYKILKETSEKTGTTFIEEMEEEEKHLLMHGEIIDYDPGRSISFRLESKIHIVRVSYDVTKNGNHSVVLAESAITWKFPMNLIFFVLGPKIKPRLMEQLKSEFAELKRLCEKMYYN